MFGNFRQLTSKIQDYLTAENPGDLFAKILERLEQDFEKGQYTRPNLVRETTTAIWCSHRGMSEAELLDLLEVPSALWSPFYLSLVENLVNRNGIINFFHDHLRQAVETKYLAKKEDKIKGYRWLANYYRNRDLDERKVDELPTLLYKAGDLKELRTFITDLRVFGRMTLTEEDTFELIKFWKMLGDYSDVEKAYLRELDSLSEEDRNTDEMIVIQQALADFFMDLGLFSTAKSLMEKLLKISEEKYAQSHGTIVYNPRSQARVLKCQHTAVIDLLVKLGTVCQKQKSFEDAGKYFLDAMGRLNRVVTPQQKLKLMQAVMGWATVLYLKSDMMEAKKYLVRARELAEDVLGTRHHYVSAIINNLGQLSYKQGRVDEALGYFVQDLVLTRSEVGSSHPRIASILNEVALVYDDKNNPVAGHLFEAALVILLDTFGENHVDVAAVRYNLGVFYMANSAVKKARYQLDKSLEIYQSFLGNDHEDTTRVQDVIKLI